MHNEFNQLKEWLATFREELLIECGSHSVALEDISYNIAAIKENKIKIAELQKDVLQLRSELKQETVKADTYADAYNSQVNGFIEFLTWLVGYEITNDIVCEYSLTNRWDEDKTFMARLKEKVEAQWERKD